MVFFCSDFNGSKSWGKAVKDSIGLKKYYDLIKENYQWSERITDATVFTSV